MAKAEKSQVRIISGSLRGSRISVPGLPGLRPTPDRVRETLFNWWSDRCRGASVLDCFSGSGALGFEAASRGASIVTMIEQDKSAFANLLQQAHRLKLDNVEIINTDALSAIKNLKRSYRLVCIDPPYAAAFLRQRALQCLVEYDRLDDGAQIYVEWPGGETFELDHPQLSWRRQKKAGQIHYAIAEWHRSG